MGYSNSFNLKVEGTFPKKAKVFNCGCHANTTDLTQNFCSNCGTPLSESEFEIEDSESIIKELVEFYQDGECGYLLDEYGDCNNSGSGYNINQEIKDFSRKYPTLTFILSCQWESGLVDEGDPGTDYFFFKNGVEKKAEVKVIYTNPFTGISF